MKVGDEYFDSAEFKNLLNAYETSVNAGEPVFMDADELTDIADFYQYTNRMDKAEEAISLATSLSPGSIGPLTYRIHEALYNGDTQKAWYWLDQIIETSEPDYIYDRAEILISEGKVDEANQYLNEQFANISEEEQQDFIMDVANIFSECGQPGKAMEWITKGHSENTAPYKELMAHALFEMGKYKESQNIFNELVEADPFSNLYWTQLAAAQYMNEDYSASVQSSEYAIAIDPNDVAAMGAKANGLMKLENYEEATKFLNRYIEQVPNDVNALMQLSFCLRSMDQTEESLKVIRQAKEEAAKDIPLLVEILREEAFLLMDMGQTNGALACLNETDAMDCDHSEMMVIKGHVLMGAKRFTEAQEYYKKALKMSEDKEHTMLRIIVSIYDNKLVEDAYNLFVNFFKGVDENYSEGYAYMALCCHTLKRYDEYLAYLKMACEKNPQECKQVLDYLFPKEVAPQDYYTYTINHIKKEQ